jgi:hypothetical protein
VAQQNAIHIEGRVEWIAGNVMVIAPYGLVIAPGGTGAINIDPSHVDQTEYSGLVTGDPVAVVGTVTSSRGRVLAMSVQRLSS